MKNRKKILMLAFMFLASVSFYSQDKNADDEEILVDTQFVEVPIVVTDKSGKPILNLKQDNFVIYEDGKKQEVTDFLTTAAPFEVALFLDTSRFDALRSRADPTRRRKFYRITSSGRPRGDHFI